MKTILVRAGYAVLPSGANESPNSLSFLEWENTYFSGVIWYHVSMMCQQCVGKALHKSSCASGASWSTVLGEPSTLS